MNNLRISVPYTGQDVEPSLSDADAWQPAPAAEICRYWSGKAAPVSRHCQVRLTWSDAALHVRFDANQCEPLIVSQEPSLETKTIGLWERDVCEIFIAPDRNRPGSYLEFEVAPTGEWLDLAIEISAGERKTDWNYRSGMRSLARIEERKVVTAMKIPWSAFGRAPSPGDAWRGNLLRCVGAGPDRGYLAWSPTLTEMPNFHVPERFGEFVFVK